MESETIKLAYADKSAWGAITRVFATLVEWFVRARQRSELAQLDAWMMRDLGLTDADVQRERSKLPWQA